MHILEVKLKQHTPLIHFQHEQDGATLRASEVKPKLDRFILTKLGEGEMDLVEETDNYKKRIQEIKQQNPEKTNYEIGFLYAKEQKMLIGKGDKPSLNYKMQIKPNGEIFFLLTNQKIEFTNRHKEKGKRFIEETENGEKIKYLLKERTSDKKLIHDLKKYPLFFGNIDADINNSNEYKKLSFTDDPLDLIITTTNTTIYKLLIIDGFMCNFFMNHNFGTRQSKGFGSFYINEKDKLYISPKSEYQFDISIVGSYYDDDFEVLFSAIELFYSTLRAGINLKIGKNTKFYFKSLLFLYCSKVLNAHWDKRKVKEEFYPDNITSPKDSLEKQRAIHSGNSMDDPLTIPFDESYDVRDLLGFSTNERWLSYGDSIEKKVAIKDGTRYRYPNPNESLSIERMRSPILFKPVYGKTKDKKDIYTVHILLQDNVANLNEFKSANKICFYSKNRFGSKLFMIDLPSMFSTKNYFDYIFDKLKIDITTHVEKKYHLHDYYKILSDIYEQLKNKKL